MSAEQQEINKLVSLDDFIKMNENMSIREVYDLYAEYLIAFDKDPIHTKASNFIKLDKVSSVDDKRIDFVKSLINKNLRSKESKLGTYRKDFISLSAFAQKLIEFEPTIKNKEILNLYTYYLKEFPEIDDILIFRWAGREEVDDLFSLEENESLSSLGYLWTNHSKNNINYKDGERYLHFFPNFEDKDKILYEVDNPESPKELLEIFLAKKDILKKFIAEGYYDDENYDVTVLTEIAIPSKLLTKNNFLDCISLENQFLNSKSFDLVEDSFKKVEKMSDYNNEEIFNFE